MRFKLLFIVFIVINILYPTTLLVSPVSYRHIISLIMLVTCVWERFKSDKYLYLYYGFVFFLGISSVATGFAGTFFNKLLGTYLPFIAAYAATYVLITKHEGTNILVWTFVCIGLLNAVVTIGQYFGLEFVDNLSYILRIEYDEEYVSIIDYKDDSEGLALPGLLGSVDNGYFISATALLILYNKKSNFYLNIFLWLVAMGASFVAQERAGFMLAIVFSAFIVGDYYFTKNRTAGFVALVIVLIVSAIVVYSYMDEILSSEFRYTKGFDGDGRSEYRSITWDYLLENPMGGFFEFNSGGHHHPHNFFFNAFLFGGFLGGGCLIVLLFLQIKEIAPYVLSSHESGSAQWAFIWGVMYIDYTMNSMVHNASIVQGVAPFFIWWSAFLAYADLYKEEQINNRLKDYSSEEKDSSSII